MDTIRGVHSTGMISVSDCKDATATWFKDDVTGYDFVRGKVGGKMIDDHRQLSAMMGHNRAATLGAVNRQNAHPFRVNNIILMHNGTLRTTANLRGNGLYDVDSNVIAHSIDCDGVEETVKKLNGAFALAWYDLADGTVNFCRNDERPLWFGKVEEPSHYKLNPNNMWVYASELGMLKWLAGRNGLVVKNYFQLKTEQLMTFDIRKELNEPVFSNLEYRKEPVNNYRPNWAMGGYEHFPPIAPASRDSGAINIDGGQVIPGERQEFYPSSFEPSKYNATWGTIRGFMAESPWASIEVLSVPIADLDLESSIAKDKEILAFPIGKVYSANVLRLMTHPYEHLVLANSSLKVEDKPEKVIDMLDWKDPELHEQYVPGPGNLYIPISEWRKVAQDGCSYCSGNIDEEDVMDVCMIDSQTMLCSECVFDNAIEGKS